MIRERYVETSRHESPVEVAFAAVAIGLGALVVFDVARTILEFYR